MSQKVSYAYKIIDPVIHGFIPNEAKGHLQTCDHSIINFGLRGLCLGFSNTSHVDSLDRSIKSVVDQVKIDVCIKPNKIIENKIK